MEAAVAERGQITLPKAVRDALGSTKGRTLKVELDAGPIILHKNVDDAVARVRSRPQLPSGLTTDGTMCELRGRVPGDPMPDWARPTVGPHSAPKPSVAPRPRRLKRSSLIALDSNLLIDFIVNDECAHVASMHRTGHTPGSSLATSRA